MLTEQEINAKTIREGKSHVTYIDVTVVKDDETYSVGKPVMERVDHDLEEARIWSDSTASVWIAAANLRQSSIIAGFKTVTYTLEGNTVNAITDVTIREIADDA